MEKAATDIYTFARLRDDGFTYVDKTDALYAMASGEAGAQFFIVPAYVGMGEQLAESVTVEEELPKAN